MHHTSDGFRGLFAVGVVATFGGVVFCLAERLWSKHLVHSLSDYGRQFWNRLRRDTPGEFMVFALGPIFLVGGLACLIIGGAGLVLTR